MTLSLPPISLVLGNDDHRVSGLEAQLVFVLGGVCVDSCVLLSCTELGVRGASPRGLSYLSSHLLHSRQPRRLRHWLQVASHRRQGTSRRTSSCLCPVMVSHDTLAERAELNLPRPGAPPATTQCQISSCYHLLFNSNCTGGRDVTYLMITIWPLARVSCSLLVPSYGAITVASSSFFPDLS